VPYGAVSRLRSCLGWFRFHLSYAHKDDFGSNFTFYRKLDQPVASYCGHHFIFMAKVAFRALLVVACVGCAKADGFLSGRQQEISTDDVQETLQSLLLSTSSLELKSIEDTLRPMFVALPKNQHGTLEHATVRYALNRYFVQTHGWYMNGLDLQTDGRNSVFAPTLMKDRAPSFIQGILEQRLQGEGLGLHDLAVFAATMSNLVHQEAVGKLQAIFDAMAFPTEGEIPRGQSEIAVKNFVIRGMWVLARRWTSART